VFRAAEPDSGLFLPDLDEIGPLALPPSAISAERLIESGIPERRYSSTSLRAAPGWSAYE